MRNDVPPAASVSIFDHSDLGTSSIEMPPMSSRERSAPWISSSQGRIARAAPGPTVLRRHAPVEDEGAGLLVVQRFAEELREIEHLDTPFLHLRHKVVVVLARLVNPYDIVEQQIVAVAGGEALMGPARWADHHRLQLSDLGVDAETASHETSLYLLA
jgi:hypothetical protein